MGETGHMRDKTGKGIILYNQSISAISYPLVVGIPDKEHNCDTCINNASPSLCTSMLCLLCLNEHGPSESRILAKELRERML